MRYNEFLKEASTLNALGVDRAGIKNIHHVLELNHDTEFTPIKNKTEAKAAMRNRAIIAVNAEGKAYGLAFYDYPMRGGMKVITASSGGGSWPDVDSLSKAIAAVKGKGFKWYKSSTPAGTKSKGSSRPDYSYGEDFADKIRHSKFNDLIKSDAAAAATKVKHHLVDVLDDTVDTSGDGHRNSYTPSHHDLNQIKKSMQLLKRISEKGIDAFEGTWSSTHGSTALLKGFFSSTYEYELDGAIKRFQEDNKLGIHKFVKYIRKELSNIAERATTGGFEDYGKKAKDYDPDYYG